MGEEQLLQIAQEFLKTPKGKKLLGESLNIAEITDRISSLSSKYNIDLTKLSSSTKKEKTRASNASNKIDQTLTAKERIQNKSDALKQESAARIDSIKDEIIALKAKLKSEIPVLEEFEISGRLFDKITGDVLKGAKVQLGVNLGEDVPVENPLNIDSNLIDSTPNFNFNDQVYIPIPGNNTRSNKQGEFKIKIKIPIIPKNQKTPLNLGLLYTKSSFLPASSPIINGDRTVKSNLSAASLINTKEAAKYVAQEFTDKVDQAQSLVKAIAMKPWDLVISAKKFALAKFVDVIKSKSIPMAIGIMLMFGISKLTESNRKTCPTQEELRDIIRRRNRLVRQLNQVMAMIAGNVALAYAFRSLSGVLRGIRLSMDAIPAPQAIGTPPAKDFGGLIFAQPYSFTAKLQHINDELEKLEEKYEGLGRSTLVSLVFLIAAAVTLVILLLGIDKLTQECAQEGGVSQLDLTAINQELLDLAQEQEEDGNPIIKSVNGFVFSVETDNSNPVGTLKRRFAVAKDNRGVTLLKGEPSFSSSDQILIDELVFYIQQNDLKAY